MFKSIAKNASSEIVEKKSKFIGNVYYIESIEEAEELIKQANKTYFDARHNCYAFRVYTQNGIINRFSDDGEPSGTAGSPMLNLLTSQNLANVLIIVTRYFGGILLGTGGLVKAYTAASMEALRQTKIVEKALGEEVELFVRYPDLEKMKYYFRQKNIHINNLEYGENVSVTAEMTHLQLESMLENRQNLNFTLLEYKIIAPKFIKINIDA